MATISACVLGAIPGDPHVVATLALGALGLADAPLALGVAVGTETLLLLVALMIAVALVSLGTVVAVRREARDAARLARQRARAMNELLRTVRMAENMADLGVWQYDPVTGEQQWSDGMRQLFGVDHTDEFVAGDAETLLYANDIDLISQVSQRANERTPFTLRYEIHGYDGVPRSICVQACNLFGEGGVVVRIVAVVRDVTDQISRERQLEDSRMAAIREARRARELADTDPLTGLANRRRVMAELDRLIIEARQERKPLVLIVFDIDRFKQVNDTHGHLEGDKVLRRVAQISQDHVRDLDLVGRVGGEEFVWVVPQVSQFQAEPMAQRLREAVENGSGVGAVPHVTISVGLAELQDGDTSLTLFSRADNALYAAKKGGRNTVKLAA
ncbi:MAG: GGDEF domain-containing protein [Erythrobacter sp.]|uniref:GGDEF domain-containing protein n=1 Tax=Erythrobacter sp. TaxID=1042 RepID=UPI00261AB553|nr:GGDEF domain-containing protein [Erythrobacter sp.]MDJ0978859.1 GGDEF domain-containing protein [Erythrobacter sp.]